MRRSAITLLLLLSLASATTTAAALPPKQQKRPALPSSSPSTATTTTGGSSGVSSNSVLVALLDSHYTVLSELLEKSLLLHPLESTVAHHGSNITILAPRNEALDRDLDPDFRRFLLEPRNLRSLQSLLLFHVLPARLHFASLLSPRRSRSHPTFLAGEPVDLAAVSRALTCPDAVTRADGVIHGVDRVLVPYSVQKAFNRRRRRSLAASSSISAALPTGAPEVDPRTHRLLKRPAPLGSAPAPPSLPVWDAMAPGPGPSIAPAPAPGPSTTGAHHFDGHSQVQDFISTLLLSGGYNELADILVNLTSLATELGRLVSEGYVLTVLAPTDEAMARLTTEQLASSSSAPEDILYYHVIPEYQTEESMYTAVRRFGTLRYDTLRLDGGDTPLKVAAREADGSVKFGDDGGGSAYLFDPDIYTDGRISVQGIDAVLFPPPPAENGGDKSKRPAAADAAPKRKVPAVTGDIAKPTLRRGKLLEGACQLMGVLVRRSRLTSCQ